MKLPGFKNVRVHSQLSPEELIRTTVSLKQGELNDTGALCILTGKFTGRSPKDKFIVEEEGPHKTKFDIKTRALMPLIDGARLLILNSNIKGISNTYLRFKQLAITDSKNAEIYLSCAEAFLTLSKFRTVEGLKNDDSGQYINLREMSKTDKEKLKNALTPMKDLEELIKSKFQLTQFS